MADNTSEQNNYFNSLPIWRQMLYFLSPTTWFLALFLLVVDAVERTACDMAWSDHKRKETSKWLTRHRNTQSRSR